MKTINYYESFDVDFVKSSNQDYKIPDNYKYIHTNIFYILISKIIYFIVIIISFFYSKLYLRVKIINKKLLNINSGYFIYSNHTQEVGDVLNPFLINNRHPVIICSSANLGIPVIGKILPICGALPIPNSIHKLDEFNNAVKYYAKEKNRPVVIYPEAHLWPYYTKIRPFANTSFNYPVQNNLPIFTATTTYKKSKIFKRPNIVIYIDGPFYIDSNKSRKENIKYLHDKVYESMISYSKKSNFEYIKYKKK